MWYVITCPCPWYLLLTLLIHLVVSIIQTWCHRSYCDCSQIRRAYAGPTLDGLTLKISRYLVGHFQWRHLVKEVTDHRHPKKFYWQHVCHSHHCGCCWPRIIMSFDHLHAQWCQRSGPIDYTVYKRDWHLTHWGRVTHIWVSDLTSIGSDNGLSPGRRQAIIRTNAGILLIRPLGTNFSEFLIEILIFSFKKMRLKVSSAKRMPFCLGLNELID